MKAINHVYQGNCLDLMPLVDDKSIDMILCDLPYGTTACKWDTIIPFEPLWTQYKRIIKNNGAIVLTALQPFTSHLILSSLGWFKYCWVWDKNYGANFMSLNFMPLLTHEDIIVFSCGGANQGSKEPMIYNPIMEIRDKPRTVTLNRWTKNIKNPKSDCLKGRNETTKELGEKYPKSVIRISNSNHTNRQHPTQKPVALFEYLIKTYTNEGDLVLDNCIGSGTTAIACLQTNRNFIGIELESKYVDIANKRINEFTKQLTMAGVE